MIRGERVDLRPVQRDDLPRLYEILSDLETMALQTAGPPVIGPFEAFAKWWESELGRDPQPPEFVIEVDGKVEGYVGLHDIDRHNRHCDVGIYLAKERWNQGLGQDALKAVVGFAFRHLGMRRVQLEVLAEDARAVGAYKKVGFVEEGTARERDWHDGRHKDVLLMAILRSEWKDEPPG
jgi:RimJ/RimL family protein N-acetyltransferase